jgi:hypothetical protein
MTASSEDSAAVVQPGTTAMLQKTCCPLPSGLNPHYSLAVMPTSLFLKSRTTVVAVVDFVLYLTIIYTRMFIDFINFTYEMPGFLLYILLCLN